MMETTMVSIFIVPKLKCFDVEIKVWLLRRRRMKDPLLLMANMIIVGTKINLTSTESLFLLVEGVCSTRSYLAKTCLGCPKLDLDNLITPNAKTATSVPIIDSTMMVVASLADGELLRSKSAAADDAAAVVEEDG
uniref:Uncharacterized protein n=1 Tax=Tanacetum cinerariifolium TaxID=118510 RepID=A0A6L2KIW1_TANCI|nr:hypothetical protein [Tanacetum cinerariifolium]